MAAVEAARIVGIGGCILRRMAGCSDTCCVNARCSVIVVTVVGLGSMATVEKLILVVAAINGGGCSGA